MRARWLALKQFARENIPFWVLLAGVALAMSLAAIGASAKSSRWFVLYSGTWLQVFGLIFVGVGLRDLRQQFGLPSVRVRMMDSLRRLTSALLGKSPPAQNIIAGTASVGVSVGEGVSLRVGAPPGASDTARIGVLEANFRNLEKDIERHFDVQGKKLAKLADALAKERHDRETTHRTISNTVQQMAVGRFDYEVVGLAWIVIGVIAACIPDEVAWLLAFIR